MGSELAPYGFLQLHFTILFFRRVPKIRIPIIAITTNITIIIMSIQKIGVAGLFESDVVAGIVEEAVSDVAEYDGELLGL